MNRLHSLKGVIASSFILIAAPVTASELPKSLLDSVATFHAAVSAGSPSKLSTISKFPMKSNEFGQIKDAKAFHSIYPKVFTAERVRGLANQPPKPLLNGIYAITSVDKDDPIQFLFKRIGNAYKLYSIDNVNE